MQRPSVRFVAAAAVVLAGSSIRLVAEHLRGVVHAGSDLLSLFIPTFAWWWERPRWLGGWNPWVFGGHPANADPQVAALHPLGLLYALTDPLQAATIDGVLTPALGGVGMIAYLRSVGCGYRPALVGALSFALGGYFTGHAPNPGLMRAAMALPWALAVVERLEGRALVAGFAATVGLVILSGHPQGIAYALALVAAYTAFFGRWRQRRRALELALGLALGVGLSAAMLLPAEELIQLSSRAFGEMHGHASPELSLAAALGLFMPFPRGGSVGPLYGNSIQVLPGCGLIECSGYPGTLPLLIVLACLPALLRSARGRFWLAAALLGVVLATGVLGAGAASLRSPARFLLWWNVAVPIAAGLALQDVTMRLDRRRSAMAVVVFAIGLAATWMLDPASRRVIAGSFVVLAAAAAVLLGARRSAAGGALLVAFVWLEMVAYVASLPFGVTAEDYRQATRATHFLRAATTALPEAEESGSLSRSLIVPTIQLLDWAPFSETLLLQGYNSLLPARIAGLLGTSPGAALAEIGWVDDPSLAAPTSHVLDLLRTDVVAVPRGAGLPLAQALDARAGRGEGRFQEIRPSDEGPWRLLVNRRARPLAWIVHSARIADAAQARALVRDDPTGAFDPTLQALVERPLEGLPAAPPVPPPTSSVQVRRFADDEIRIAAETSARGLLVTSELDYPGWTASVDGAPAAVETVNAGFRAVMLEPGRHEVVLAYRPWRSRVGVLISAVSALIVLAIALRPRPGGRRDRASRAPSSARSSMRSAAS